jgi:hypothetical protein
LPSDTDRAAISLSRAKSRMAEFNNAAVTGDNFYFARTTLLLLLLLIESNKCSSVESEREGASAAIINYGTSLHRATATILTAYPLPIAIFYIISVMNYIFPIFLYII